MGSPLFTFFAEAVMQHLETQSATNNTNIILWKRYINDIFSIVEKDKTEQILHTISNTTKILTFAKDEEHDKQLTFLDILLTRIDDDTINIHVHHKTTHTDQILQINSNHQTEKQNKLHTNTF